MKKLITLTIFLFMSATGPIISGPLADTQFERLLKKSFDENEVNTVHEWVYDFLLAAEEGDVELLQERLDELTLLDTHNYGVLIETAYDIAKSLHRRGHMSILRPLRVKGSFRVQFDVESAQSSKLAEKRIAEKVQESRSCSWAEWLMASSWFKTGFVLFAGINLGATVALGQALSQSKIDFEDRGICDLHREKPIIVLPASPLVPNDQNYLALIRAPSADFAELITALELAGGDAAGVFERHWDALNRAGDPYLICELLESVASSSRPFSQNTAPALISALNSFRNTWVHASSVASLWQTLIRRGLPSDDRSYYVDEQEPFGPMAFALQHHQVGLMEEVLGIADIEARPGEDKILSFLLRVPGLNSFSEIGEFTAFEFARLWYKYDPNQDKGLCYCLVHKLLAAEIEEFDLMKKSPGSHYYEYAKSIGAVDLVRTINKLGGNPFDDSDGYRFLEEALSDGDFFLVEAILDKSPELTASTKFSVMAYFALRFESRRPLEHARILKALIKKGLPTDENLYNAICNGECGPLAFARQWDLKDFIAELSAATALDPNERDSDGYTVFEKSLQLGYFKLAEMLKIQGGHTNRVVVIVATDSGMQGNMYNLALKGLGQRDVLVATLSPPSKDDFELMNEQGNLSTHNLLENNNKLVKELKELARIAVEHSNAIWISGGADVWEKLYNASSKSNAQDIQRDILEFAVLEEQQKHPYKPLIGVCRGLQIINVFHGGSLHNVGESGVNKFIQTTKKGTLGSAFDGDDLEGWSGHHQSVDGLAPSLEMVASTSFGMVKALQSKSLALPLIATQFHPEYPPSNDKASNQVIERFLQMATAAKKQTCMALTSSKDETSL